MFNAFLYNQSVSRKVSLKTEDWEGQRWFGEGGKGRREGGGTDVSLVEPSEIQRSYSELLNDVPFYKRGASIQSQLRSNLYEKREIETYGHLL